LETYGCHDGKFSDIALLMSTILNKADEMRDNLRVAFNFHSSKELIDGYKPEVKIKTIGKILGGWFNIEELFDIVLYSDVHFENKKPVYGFITEYSLDAPAKAPAGMFEESKIVNNFQTVFDTMEAYYN